jgi:diguanylate cyclase (GGDEF)-like protein/putative nucleotidyltransferase with HDIG domain
MSGHRRAGGMRLLAWSGLIVLALLRIAFTSLGPEGEAIASWVLSLLPILLGLAGAAAVCVRVNGDERRFWVLLTVAVALVMIGEVHLVYTVLFVDPRGLPMPDPVQLLYAGAIVAFLAMLVSLTRFGAEPLVVRLRFYVDVMLAMVVPYVAAYRWLIAPVFEDIPRRTIGLLLIGSAYPVVGLTLVVGTLAVVVGWKVERWQPWERLFAASLTIYAAGMLLWPWWYLGRQQAGALGTTDTLLDYLFMAGFYLLFIAAVYRITEPDSRPVPRAYSAPIGKWPVWLAPVLLGSITLCVPLLAWASATAANPVDSQVYLSMAVVLVFLLGLRSWLSTLEGSYLLAESVTDQLTGLPNRRAFQAALHTAVSPRSGTVSVIALDVDGFRRIDEIGGRSEGDRVLREAAAAVADVFRSEGELYRLADDDLIALVPGAGPVHSMALATESVAAVERSVRWGSMAVSVSAGVASAPVHGSEAEGLVRKALTAREWARASGGARARVYDDGEGHLLDPAERLERIRRGDHLSTVRALASAVDARDPYAPEHSRTVAHSAAKLAREIGLSEERTALVETAALLHDIGKLAVDDRVLSTPHLLTQAERERIQDHPVFGERILRSAGVDEILPWVRHHHERWDGSGYPDGLQAEKIPIEARIIAIADAYEVMTSGRPYQPALSHHAALRHIELEAGSHFDPSLASAFVRIMWDEG